MKSNYGLRLFVFLLLSLFLCTCLAPLSHAYKPRKKAPLDMDGCRVCTKNCKRRGFQHGEKYCLIFPSGTTEGMNKDMAKVALFGVLGAAFIDHGQSEYRRHLTAAVEQINLNGDRSRLVLVGSEKDISGQYRIKYGKKASVSKGASTATIFEGSVQNGMPGLYTLNINNKSYPLLHTESDRLLVVRGSNEVLCAGANSKNQDKLTFQCDCDFARNLVSVAKMKKNKSFCKLTLLK